MSADAKPRACECPARNALEGLRRYFAVEGRPEGEKLLVGLAYDSHIWGPAADPTYEMYELAEAVEKWLHAEVAAAVSTPCPCEGLREERWECFHCGFKTSDPAEAEAHFGERDDAPEFTPTCTWWAKLSTDERAQEFQDLRQELNSEREESGRLNIANEGLEHRLVAFEHVIDARFKGARSINDIFHLYDTMEGLKLVAERERDQLRAELATATNALEAARVFIADELETRERSFLPNPEPEEQEFIDTARKSLSIVDAAIFEIRPL